MSLTLLKTLIAIADTGSFSAAANVVCVTQAAVGQQMQRLEGTLGVKLFDRTGKSPKLTALGHTVVSRARETIQSYDTLLDGLTGDARLTGELTVGAIPSLISALVPRSIRRLVATYPDLHTRVVPGLNEDLLEQVERGAVDAAIMSAPSYLSHHLTWRPFATETFVLITAPEVTETDPLNILRDMPYIRHQRRTVAGGLVDAWLLENNITVRAAMEMDSLETVSSMVAHNLGVSVVPNSCVPDTVFSTLRKRPLGDLGSEPVSRVLGILTPAECPKIQLVNALFEEIKATVTEHADIHTHTKELL